MRDRVDATPAQSAPRRALAAVLVAYALLVIASNYVFPVFEAPDEPSHFAYVRLLAAGRGLPVETDPARSVLAEGFNPPLYYLLGGLWLRVLDPTRGAGIDVVDGTALDVWRRARALDFHTVPPINPRFVWFAGGDEPNRYEHPEGGPFAPGPLAIVHALRFVSLACGLCTLLGIAAIARLVLAGAPWAQVVAVAAVAFDPQFVYLSSVLNSDNLVTAFATLLSWRTSAVACGRRSRGEPLLMGGLFGLGILAKPNMLFLAIPAVLALFGARRSRTRWLRDAAGFALVAGALGGWFFVRNAALYGWSDPLGWQARAQLHPLFVSSPGERWHFWTRELLPTLFLTYWGVFGWLTIRLPAWQYAIYLALGSWSLGSLVARMRRGPPLGRASWLLLVALALNLASLAAFNFQFRAHQGRLLFPTIATTAWLVGAAFERALAGAPGRRTARLAIGFCTAGAALVAVALGSIYRGVYQ